MNNGQKKLINQRGFTLIEMLIAIAIAGLIISSIAAVIMQTVTVSAADSKRMEAVKQVENALHWIDRDAQMTSRNSLNTNNPTLPNFPLKLSWINFDGEQHAVTYSIVSGVLQRSESVNGGTASVSSIAQHIVAASSNYTFDGRVLIVNLTSTTVGFGSASESRTLYVIPRVGQ